MKNILTFLLALLLSTLNATAQRERNYIYVLDCTRSMTGVGNSPNIWQPTKNYLRDDITRQTPTTEIHVLPFQEKVLTTFDFEARAFDWKSMEKELDRLVTIPANTNICDAWSEAEKYINPNKDNYIYLLTDGQDNIKGMNELARRLSTFCGKYRNTRAFYVVLTTSAIHPKIKEIVDCCPDERFVDASKKIEPFGSFDSDATIYANTLALERQHRLSFSAAGEFPATIVCTDPNFDVSVIGRHINDGILSLQVKARRPISEINAQLPEVYDFDIELRATGVDVINPCIHVHITNKAERQLEIVGEEQDMGRAKWYKSFLCWGASRQDTLSVDLRAVFNAEATKDGSTATFKVTPTEGKADYQLFFNGQPTTDGLIRLDAKHTERAILSLVFNDDAAEGRHYLQLSRQSTERLESINGAPAEQYELTLRSRYSVGWNPLATILFWLLVAIVAALILWFVIMRPLLYPTFKVGSITITDPYYANVRLKGARRVIFTNRRQEQSLISRIFTRPIICNVNAVWTTPLTLEPAKKKVRASRTTTYVFDPYGSLLNGHTDYTIENTTTHDKIKMTIN